MIKLPNKEFIWFTATVLLILIINLILIGSNSGTEFSKVVNIHDTYFVITFIPFFVFNAVLIFFGIYLLRAIYYRFKNFWVNIIFLLAILLSILVFIKLIAFTANLIGPDEEYDQTWPETLKYILYYIQIALLLLFGFTAIKTGRLYKKKEKISEI